MALQKYRMAKALVISFTTASPLLNALKGKEQLRLSSLIHVSKFCLSAGCPGRAQPCVFCEGQVLNAHTA